jgi:SAM-dependent methyltransferase
MLARQALPAAHAEWNRRWGAPAGYSGRSALAYLREPTAEDALREGMFGAQVNSTTRRAEYPWAFHAVRERPGGVAVEVGGGLSGLQFALSKHGTAVINVDPFSGYGQDGESSSAAAAVTTHARLNSWFGTSAELRACRLAEAGIGACTVDTGYCISVIEHLADEEITAVLGDYGRILRPGGRLVLTVDLFLDIAPFTPAPANEWGRNIDIFQLIADSGLRLADGVPAELRGFPEFRPEQILAHLPDYEVNEHYPQLAQLFVLVKPG